MATRQECRARRARSRSRSRRGDTAELARLAGFLDEPDRRLIEQVYVHGVPIKGVAAVAGTRPGALRRRLDRLRKRMHSMEFRVISECLDLFPSRYQSVAKARVLHGHSLERVARDHGLTVHQVRQRLCAIDALVKVGRQLMAASAVSGLTHNARRHRPELAAVAGPDAVNED